jgi:hypothetical protein
MNTGWCGRVLLLSVPFLLLALATAQDTQRVEVFGGYSLLHDHSLVPYAANFSGWDTSTTIFLNRWLGATADFSGHYASTTWTAPPPFPGATGGTYEFTNNPYSFLFGPHFTYRRSRYAPFGQALFGVTHSAPTETTLIPPLCPSGGSGPIQTCGGSVSGSSSSTDFTMALGGGLDIDLGHGVSVRPVQADYILERYVATIPDNGIFVSHTSYFNYFRYSAGLVFRFGPHLGK